MPNGAPSPQSDTLKRGLTAAGTLAVLCLLTWNPYIFSHLTIALAIVLALTLASAVIWNWVSQLADILNPNSAAESKRIQFPLGRLRFTVDWIINIIWVIFDLLLAMRIMWLVQSRGLCGPWHVATGHGLVDTVDRVLVDRLMWWPMAVHGVALRYSVVLVVLWFVASLPAWWSMVRLFISKLAYRKEPERVDVHGLSMVCTLALLSLITLALPEWLLGILLHVGRLAGPSWWALFLPFAPLAVFVTALFSRYWPDTGKGVSNKVRGNSTLRKIRLADAAVASEPVPAGGETPCEQPLEDDGQTRQSHEGPMVVLCASGGGSRAALFTAGIMNRMWWQPGPDGGELYPGRALLQRADILSSVSGGSLAFAYFQDALFQDFKSSGRPGLPLDDRNKALDRFFNCKLPGDVSMKPGDARPTTRWYGEDKTPGTLERFFMAPSPVFDNAAAAEAVPSSTLDQNRSEFEAHPFINAMCQDHLAATMAGFFRPWVGRGPGLERYWERRFRWYGAGDRNALTVSNNPNPRLLSDFRADELEGRLPVLMLNGTLVRTGTRVAITNLGSGQFQALPKYGPEVDPRDLGECTPSGTRGLVAQQKRVVAIRRAERRYDPLPGQISTLNGLDPYWDIPLKTATRASAGFPGGFPFMRFYRRRLDATNAEDSLYSYEGRPDVLEITDGGVIDNTALDSVMALVRANSADIRRRGLLIFQIDSGELPTSPAVPVMDPMLHNLTEVASAMWRAGNNNQAALHSLYLDELCRVCGEAAPLTPCAGNGYVFGYVGENCAFFQVRAGELAREHVMTSWHLNANTRATLYQEICGPEQGEAILRAAEWLSNFQGRTLSEPK